MRRAFWLSASLLVPNAALTFSKEVVDRLPADLTAALTTAVGKDSASAVALGRCLTDFQHYILQIPQ